MQTVSTFLLIAMLRTVNEGGAIQQPTETLEQCQALGTAINDQFEAIPLGDSGRFPSVIWQCVELPGQ